MTLADWSLSNSARRTLGRMAHVVCPPDLAALGIEREVVDHYELMLRAFPDLVRLGLTVAVWVFELAAIVYPPSLFRPFSWLPRARQERYFAFFWHSRLNLVRQVVKTMKGLLVMGYYEHEVVKARLTYHPDRWIAEQARARIERFSPEIAAHEDAVTAPDPLIPSTSLRRKARDAQA